MRIGSRYESLGRIGQGGMGIVWRAHDELLDRDVAIKEVLLPPELAEAERAERYARTIREARSAARLNHPGVITVYDVVEEDGRPWIVMELIGAPSLQSTINADGRLPPHRVAGFGRQMVAALRAAHAAGIVHRDIKPSNVLVAAADRVVITDFGIAALEGDATLTKSGAMIGSPAYLAPERVRGDSAGPPADLWSLGITLYAAVEGRSPFERSGTVPTLAAIMGEEVPPAPHAGPLAPALAGLLRKDPADRITAAEADRLLARAAHPEPGTVADLGAPAPPASRPTPEDDPASPAQPQAAPPIHPAPTPVPAEQAESPPGPPRPPPPRPPQPRPATSQGPVPGDASPARPAPPGPASAAGQFVSPGQFVPPGQAGSSDQASASGQPAQAGQPAFMGHAGAADHAVPAGQPPAQGFPAPRGHPATAAQAALAAPAGSGTARRPVALVAVSALTGALVVTALVVVWLLGRTSAGNDPAGTSSPQVTGAQPGSGGPTTPAAGGSAASPAGGIPADWSMRHESGFSVAVPAAWSRRGNGGNVLYEDATTRFLLQVGPVAWDGDPQARMTVSGLSREFRGFRESSVTQVTYRGGAAVDIRFAYDRSTGVERGHIRLFHVGQRSFMIFFRMPAEEWSRASNYLDPIFNSFRPT